MNYFITFNKVVELKILDRDTGITHTIPFNNKSQAEYAKHLLHKHAGQDYTIPNKYLSVINREGVKDLVNEKVKAFIKGVTNE